MPKSAVVFESLPEFPLWKKTESRHIPLAFDLEITARCNNNCRHCYINLPAADRAAREQELTLEEISALAAQAVELGALWCLITGGEPLLRADFAEIYLGLKKKGLLVSVFTNACLITAKHVKLFQKYPPRDIEVTVYGMTCATYERVTRQRGSFAAFRRGLDLLLQAGLNVRLKAMALSSNRHELAAIAAFCRERTTDYFRFDPFLHLRFDGNPRRNREISQERLSPAEVVAVEQADGERARALARHCDQLIDHDYTRRRSDNLFFCTAGNSRFSVSYDGLFRLCSSLWHPDCLYDLRKGTLAEAWHKLVPAVLAMRSNRKQFREKCRVCSLNNLCIWCPATACLEHGQLDAWCRYFCEVAHARAEAIKPGAIAFAAEFAGANTLRGCPAACRPQRGSAAGRASSARRMRNKIL